MSTPDLATLTAEHFEPCLNQAFRLLSNQAGDAGIALRLAAIDRRGLGGRQGGGFVLTFVGEQGPYRPQAIYPLAHETLGTIEIFLVPIGPTEGGNGYEAVFG